MFAASECSLKYPEGIEEFKANGFEIFLDVDSVDHSFGEDLQESEQEVPEASDQSKGEEIHAAEDWMG